jgi:hypothetical protein
MSFSQTCSYMTIAVPSRFFATWVPTRRGNQLCGTGIWRLLTVAPSLVQVSHDTQPGASMAQLTRRPALHQPSPKTFDLVGLLLHTCDHMVIRT